MQYGMLKKTPLETTQTRCLSCVHYFLLLGKRIKMDDEGKRLKKSSMWNYNFAMSWTNVIWINGHIRSVAGKESTFQDRKWPDPRRYYCSNREG